MSHYSNQPYPSDPAQHGQYAQQVQQHPQQHGQPYPGQQQYTTQPPIQGQTPQAEAPRGPPPSQTQVVTTDQGAWPGGTYAITHRDTNAVLTVDIAQGGSVRSRPGAMIHMAGTVQLTGQVKFSLKKMFTGGEMSESTYAGCGRVALGPTLFGDIVTLQVDQSSAWKVGRDAFLACTPDVRMQGKSQGFGKALFSGENMFVLHVSGSGVMWLTSFGAVDKLVLRPGEEHIVDNGHLVAWNCDYKIEKAGGGMMASMKTGEGLVCRFTGPGAVYIQTRNQGAFNDYIRAVSGPQQ